MNKVKIKGTSGFLIFIFLFIVQIQIAFSVEVPVVVGGPNVFSFPVVPGMTQVDFPLSLSAVKELAVEVMVPVNGATLSISDPLGNVIVSSSAGSIDFISGETLRPGEGLPGGVFTADGIVPSLDGVWHITATFPEATEKTIVMATVLVQTEYAIGFALIDESPLSGIPVPISLLALKGGLPAPGAVPLFTITPNDGLPVISRQLALDDGIDFDGAANDGIFTLEYNFNQPGVYILTAEVDFVGEEGTVKRSTQREITVVEPAVVSDGVTVAPLYGVGCVSGVEVAADLTFKNDGEYTVNVVITSPSGATLETGISQTFLMGAQRVSVLIDKDQIVTELGESGPYSVSYMNILRAGESAFEQVYVGYDLADSPLISLENFCAAPIVVGSATISEVVDGGFVQGINFEIPVSVSKSGYYDFSFKIIDAAGNGAGLIGARPYLAVGQNTTTITASASHFQKGDGPYRAISLLLLGPSGSAQVSSLGQTSTLSRWQFAPKITGDLNGDGAVNSVDRDLLVSFRNVQALVPGDRRDLTKNGIIDLLDVRMILGFQCAVGSCSENY